MSRFSNLEFNHESEGQLSQEQLVKDESYYLGSAERAFVEADFERALRDYSKVLEFNPANPRAWSGQVRALIELGETREARLWAEKALEKFPRDGELLAAKGAALAREGDLDAALAFSDAAMQERGETPYLWLARGDVLLARAERRAGYCFEKALLLAGKDWVMAWLASRVLHFYHQFALALQRAEQAVEWNSAAPVTWFQLGLCQQELGLRGAARHSLVQARQLNPQLQGVEEALTALDNMSWWSRLQAGWRRLFPA